ncbi:MAG: short-chain dehydrogenase/reductase [Solirubrobacterales bacterium]
MKFPADGKVALITGAAGGIGLGTARALYKRGASIVMTDLDAELTQAAADTIAMPGSVGSERLLVLAADVTDPNALDNAVAAGVKQFGGIDIVIANAGISAPLATVRASRTEDFQRVIDVDLIGVWNTVKAGLDQVIERQGHVVVVASIYAFFNGVGQSPYAVAKAGVEQLGRAMRAELIPHGASAGVAYFGFIDTAMVRGALTDPLADEIIKHTPPGLQKQLSQDEAGEAIARGVERRAIKTLVPKRWNLLKFSRGWMGPLDDFVIRNDGRLKKLILRIDVPVAERMESEAEEAPPGEAESRKAVRDEVTSGD